MRQTMFTAIYPSTAPMTATQPKSRQILGINQQAYQALRASLGLNLRRQLLIAVCDSVVLQNQLASQLEHDLAEKSWLATQARGNSLALTSNGAPSSISLKLERLIFDPKDAHLPRQVAHWVRRTTLAGHNILPQVQMLGIEQMTQQPAIIQNHFLRSLEQVEALLPRLNTSLLVWVPWPWLRTIQSSSPAFWKWRNGVFEFVSDPTTTTAPPDTDSGLDADRSIDNQQVVALYGETDDSDLSDCGQPALETIATWDTVDVDAMPVYSAGASLSGASASKQTQADQDESETQAAGAPTAINKAHLQSAADGYFKIGRRYRSRIESGERGLDMIEPAIAAYECGLRCLSGPHLNWGSGLNDLGTLYWLKAQQLSDPQQVVDCMNHSVELYAEALTKIDTTRDPDMACQLYSNMGAVYSMLATQLEPVHHFKQAAEAYQQSLPLCSLTDNPDEYAILHNSLGSLYWKLSHYEQAPDQVQQHLKNAIAAYKQALIGYRAEARPLDYAAVQNNLGITYWSLAKHTDSVPALNNAIAAYRNALNYRTPESDPAACAITYNNLALAYWDLSKNETVGPDPKLRYQRNAVATFEAALQIAATVGSLSQMDSAAIYHCLGDVHAQMVDNAPSLTEVADSLQKSLYSYVQAIDGMPTASPVFEARLKAIIANLRSHHQHLGLASQQAALNRVPPHLISQVMQAL